ncbi:unnamed protein product [Rotaria sp. Silwood1]|nr:unnamed protein product [Rotaria sp. Silwood1]
MLLRNYSTLRIFKSIFRRTHTLIDYKTYPLHDRESNAYNKLILNSRQEFLSTGCLYLSHFLTQETLSNILNEINSILTNSSRTLYNSYVEHTDNLYSTSTSNKNLNEIESSSKTIIAYDQIPNESLLRKIYSWNSLTNFITDIIQIYPHLYPSCDELGALYINIYGQSNKLTSIYNEGIFEYKTKNNNEIISRNDFQAGSLVLFNGRAYVHRVTEVRLSKLPRINAILTYDCNPDHRLSDYVLKKFFGRTMQKQ